MNVNGGDSMLARISSEITRSAREYTLKAMLVGNIPTKYLWVSSSSTQARGAILSVNITTSLVSSSGGRRNSARDARPESNCRTGICLPRTLSIGCR